MNWRIALLRLAMAGCSLVRLQVATNTAVVVLLRAMYVPHVQPCAILGAVLLGLWETGLAE